MVFFIFYCPGLWEDLSYDHSYSPSVYCIIFWNHCIFYYVFCTEEVLSMLRFDRRVWVDYLLDHHASFWHVVFHRNNCSVGSGGTAFQDLRCGA